MANRELPEMEKKPIRTGVFSGSFNPIHIGHLALANYLCEYGEVDEVWFLVTPQNPFKQKAELLGDDLRLEMVRRAVAGYPRFVASDFEFRLPRPSYTVNTLHHLAEAYPDREFYLIIGADNWASFAQWKSPEEILAHHHLLIYPRRPYEVAPESLPARAKAVDTPLLEISATFIRRSIEAGKDIRYFLHPEVWKIIEEQKLYRKS